ncbi:phospholipase D [Dichotomopilus funicola]|uniref:Phospholipase D n=1 Tax=Dichotomopilus funicola TaxID=1934379 RepID=A0AAN6ZIL0_9PEZI|nr:phospholipase D [Dichotomopilus funicola]
MERNISAASAQPFYMIAHRVLTVQGVNDALSHGANALEIDMTAWSDGWILYGFYDATSKAYVRIRGNLINEEAINLNGRVEDVAPAFAKGPEARFKKVMSYGYYNLPFQFGNGHEKRYYTCTELRMAARSHEYGKVFGWTTAAGQAYYVDKLLGEAGVDGLIYGFKMTYYYDHENTRAAAGDIISWVRNHPEKRFMAGKGDFPW